MGCDIHSFAEVKINDKWQTVGRVFPAEYHRSDRVSIISRSDDETWESNEPLSIEPYGGRNYHLFAILAGVRNNNDITPISNPRGIPADASDYVKHEAEEYGRNGHSHSWLTLAELEAYDWAGLQPDAGYVSVKEYEQFKANGRPSSWCAGVGGGSVVIVTNEVMDHIIAYPPRDGNSYYTRIEWQWAPVDSTKVFVERTIPALKDLLTKDGVEDVRFVFFFDN